MLKDYSKFYLSSQTLFLQKMIEQDGQKCFSNSSISQVIQYIPVHKITKSKYIPVQKIVISIICLDAPNHRKREKIWDGTKSILDTKKSVHFLVLCKVGLSQYILQHILFSQYNQYIPVYLSEAGHPAEEGTH